MYFCRYLDSDYPFLRLEKGEENMQVVSWLSI